MVGDWDSFDDEVDKLVSDEVKRCARTSWTLMSVYLRQDQLSELDGIMKCAHRLIKLFLSDDIDEIYKFDSEFDRLYLSISALKISWTLLAQNKIEDFNLNDFSFDMMGDSGYEWILYDASAKKKMLTYEFQLMKYPYNRCFSYMRYDVISKEEFNDNLKKLIIEQTGVNIPNIIDEYFPHAYDNLAGDSHRMEEYMKFHPEGNGNDIREGQYPFFDMPELIKMDKR